MDHRNAAKPATAADGEPASNFERSGGRLEVAHTPTAITAQLLGTDIAVANGITASGALDLCRRLLAAGADPDAELVCYRGAVVALRVRSIGAGARLAIRETAADGPRIVRWRPFLAAPSGRAFDKNADGYLGCAQLDREQVAAS